LDIEGKIIDVVRFKPEPATLRECRVSLNSESYPAGFLLITVIEVSIEMVEPALLLSFEDFG